MVANAIACVRDDPDPAQEKMSELGNGRVDTSPPPPPYESVANEQVSVFRNEVPFPRAGKLYGAREY